MSGGCNRRTACRVAVAAAAYRDHHPQLFDGISSFTASSSTAGWQCAQCTQEWHPMQLKSSLPLPIVIFLVQWTQHWQPGQSQCCSFCSNQRPPLPLLENFGSFDWQTVFPFTLRTGPNRVGIAGGAGAKGCCSLYGRRQAVCFVQNDYGYLFFRQAVAVDKHLE